MTAEARAEVEGPTWQDWEGYASTDPQPEGQLLQDVGFSLERYWVPAGDYLVAWIKNGSGMFPLSRLLSDVGWHSEGKAVFLGAVQDDTGEATEMVWFSAR